MTESPDQPPDTPSSPYLPGGYPPPYPGFPSPPKNGLGIASLVIAIVALVSVWSVFGGVALGIVAVVIGFVARGRVKRGEADNGGVVIAGIVLGLVAIIVGLVFAVIWVALFKDVGGGDYLDCLRKAGSDRASQQRCADQFREHLQETFSVTPTP